MISTGLKHLHALPSLPSTSVNWLPVDICASSIASALSAASHSTTTYTVHNLVNPSTISWSTFLSALAAATSSSASTQSFQTVSMHEWVAMLEKAADEEGRHGEVPGLKLLGFFQEMAGVGMESSDAETKGRGKNGEGVEFATSSVRGARPVDVEMVRLWLQRWSDEGFV